MSQAMPNMTLAISDELLEEMRAHPEINWSEITRRSIRRELERLHVIDALLRGSKLTDKDAVEIGRSIRRNAAQRRS